MESSRANKVPYLIVLEGQDRTGKDTLISNIISHYGKENIIEYRQETCQDAGVDYRNKEQFEAYLCYAMKQTFDKIRNIHQDNPDKLIVTSRLWISDDVYSDMFNRRHIVSSYFRPLFEQLFDGNVFTFVMVWDSFSTFLDRMDFIDDEYSRNEYSAIEFEKVKDLFEKYGGENDASILNITHEMPASKILESFLYKASSLF